MMTKRPENKWPDKARQIAESMGLGGLLLDKIMPPLYYMCLMAGQTYKCGSDYSDNMLNASVDDLMTNAEYFNSDDEVGDIVH